MRIIFVTQDDPFYIPVFFREYFKNCLSDKIEICGVVIQAPLGKKKLFKLVKQMFDFYGYLGFIRIGIKFAFYKFMNIIAVSIFKGNFPGCFSLKHFLLKRKCNIIHLENINSDVALEKIKSLELDLIVSITASQKFRNNILQIPKYGCLNIHNSKLPKNRGMLPNFWALFNYDIEPYSGITVHKMNEKLDDGEIVYQEDFLLNSNESLHNLILRTKKLNANIIKKAILLFENGEPTYFVNDASLSTYNSFPTKADVKKFKRKGLKLL